VVLVQRSDAARVNDEEIKRIPHASLIDEPSEWQVVKAGRRRLVDVCSL
jgi:hypothetical protein